jgi:hypothetical protein
LADLPRLAASLFEAFGVDDRLFLRPDAADKDFGGGLVDREYFDGWWRMANWFDPPPEALAVAASPRTIFSEYRFIVADGKVVGGSRYRLGSFICVEAEYPKSAAAFAETVAAKWRPQPIFCLDVAETPEGFRIIECNPFNTSGLYAVDLRATVVAASQIAEREWSERWVA